MKTFKEVFEELLVVESELNEGIGEKAGKLLTKLGSKLQGKKTNFNHAKELKKRGFGSGEHWTSSEKHGTLKSYDSRDGKTSAYVNKNKGDNHTTYTVHRDAKWSKDPIKKLGSYLGGSGRVKKQTTNPKKFLKHLGD